MHSSYERLAESTERKTKLTQIFDCNLKPEIHIYKYDENKKIRSKKEKSFFGSFCLQLKGEVESKSHIRINWQNVNDAIMNGLWEYTENEEKERGREGAEFQVLIEIGTNHSFDMEGTTFQALNTR